MGIIACPEKVPRDPVHSQAMGIGQICKAIRVDNRSMKGDGGKPIESDFASALVISSTGDKSKEQQCLPHGNKKGSRQ